MEYGFELFAVFVVLIMGFVTALILLWRDFGGEPVLFILAREAVYNLKSKFSRSKDESSQR